MANDSEGIPTAHYLALAAGPLRMQLDTRSGFLRYIRYGEVEVLRGIYVAVRDRNWGTVTPHVSELHSDSTVDGQRTTFTVECRRGDIDFLWHGTLTTTDSGSVSYEMHGIARNSFHRNRIGFCVLHPIRECAGRPCEIVRSDGTVVRGSFPQAVSPHQPFTSMRSITHEIAAGLQAVVEFEGDVFEMEDQRNWSDASFKTYCTPLSLPFPVEVAAGTVVQQRVVLRLIGQPLEPLPAPMVGASTDCVCRIGRAIRLPRLGLGTASHGQPLTPHERNRIRDLDLDHLRLDLALEDPAFVERLRQATEEAEALATSLQVALHFRDVEPELERLSQAVRILRPPVATWLVFQASRPAVGGEYYQTIKAVLKNLRPAALVGAGSNSNFAEANRHRLPPGTAEAVCFPITPQIHAFDDESLTETLQAQPQLVESARQFAGDVPVLVTPVTLKPRFNAVATAPEQPAPLGELPPQVDPRQTSTFLAGWTLGSLVQLAAAETSRVTYFETTGWLGVMETESGSLLPEQFPSRRGGVFPVYHLLVDIAELGHWDLRILETDDPLRIQGLLASSFGVSVFLLANLTAEPLSVQLPVTGQGQLSCRLLDELAREESTLFPDVYRARKLSALAEPRLTLPPHAYARVEVK